MAIVRRFIRINGGTGAIQVQDDGPGTWGVNKTSTGVYQITFPQPMTWNMALFTNAHGNPYNQANIGIPYFTAVTGLTQTGCTVRSFNSNTTVGDAQFLLELIGEPQ